MRLWLGYPAAIFSSLGLLLWGLSIDRNWHWITGQIAFFLCKSLKPRLLVPRGCANERQLLLDCRWGIQPCQVTLSIATMSTLWMSSHSTLSSST
jgi:hypothetical protein